MNGYEKTTCLQRLAQEKNCNWDDCEKVWEELSNFAKPHLEKGIPDFRSPSFSTVIEEWSKSASFPNLKLDFNPKERNYMLKAIFWNAEKDHVLARYGRPATKFPAKRPRIPTSSGSNSNSTGRSKTSPAQQVFSSLSQTTITTDEPATKRQKKDNERRSLPADTKVYVTEEGKRDSRTSVPISLFSKNDNPENDHLEISSLYFGKMKQILCKRTVYEKETHEIFYYDLENRKVHVIVDNCYSFRTGVQEMAFHGGSKSKIKFYIREKDLVPRTTAPANPSPMPKYTAEEPPRGPRAWTLPLQRKLDFRGDNHGNSGRFNA